MFTTRHARARALGNRFTMLEAHTDFPKMENHSTLFIVSSFG